MINHDKTLHVYKRFRSEDEGGEIWRGHEVKNVRAELSQSWKATTTGTQNGMVLDVSVFDVDMPEELKWDKDCYFAVAEDQKLQEFTENNRFPMGFLQFLTKKYPELYHVTAVQHFSLIPHWEIKGE